jgi:hypothetical protein
VSHAGYWHQQQMQHVVDRGIQVLIPPDATKRKGARPPASACDGRHLQTSSIGADGRGARRIEAPRVLSA